jgi:hypothetical protein
LERAVPGATHGGGQAIAVALEPTMVEAAQGGGQGITAGLEPAAADATQQTQGDGHTG